MITAENPTRRTFIKSAAAAAVGTAAAPLFAGVQPAGSDAIRVGLIGCGGRGSGAAEDILSAAPGVTIVAMGDAFPDRLDQSLTRIKGKFPNGVDVPADRQFVGLDAYQRVLASDVNYVILTTPPAFRPRQLKAAVAAGKHIFTEKPVAVDAPGIRSVLETYDEARAKGLGIAAGTQRRHQTGYLETMKRIHDGAIGRIVSARCYWNQGLLWNRGRQPSWTDLEWQLRNWLYFTWLSGDHIVEQHVHNIDVINWAMRGHPVRALGLGGRQVRTAPEWGHIYDHFAVDFEYEDGTPLMSMCRQIGNCDNRIAESLVGERGTCSVDKYTITGPRAWKFGEQDNRPYRQEHADLVASIRAGKPINELKTVAESTLTAIMGRMSTYTGKAVTWEQALNSQERLGPEQLSFEGPMPVPPVAMPGITKFS